LGSQKLRMVKAHLLLLRSRDSDPGAEFCQRDCFYPRYKQGWFSSQQL